MIKSNQIKSPCMTHGIYYDGRLRIPQVGNEDDVVR